MALAISIDGVERGDGIDLHRRHPAVKIRGAVHRIPLFDLADLVHAGIADGVIAMIGAHDRPMTRPPHITRHRPADRSENTDRQARRAMLEIEPFAVEAVAIALGLQHIDVRQVRLVDRMGPAEIGIEAVQDKRRPGEGRAGHVPAIFGVQARLIPGHRPFKGLVRID